jgi:hypothetical protein
MSNLTTRIEALTSRIAKDQATLADLIAKDAAGITVEKLVPGTEVVAVYGRGDTKKELSAKVLGVNVPVKGGTQVKITFGEGYDAEIVTVSLSAIVRIGALPVGELVVEDQPQA